MTDIVKAVKLAIFDAWRDRSSSRTFEQEFEHMAEAALAAARPLIAEECAKIADAEAEADRKRHETTEDADERSGYLWSILTATDIAAAIRGLK